MAAHERPPGAVKLLLDVHHSPTAADRLTAAGFDVIAAARELVLATLPDDEILAAATDDGRALVTENVKDFDRIVRAWAVAGRHHAGVIFTSPRRYHRGSRAYPDSLVAALTAVLSRQSFGDTPDFVHWLA